MRAFADSGRACVDAYINVSLSEGVNPLSGEGLGNPPFCVFPVTAEVVCSYRDFHSSPLTAIFLVDFFVRGAMRRAGGDRGPLPFFWQFVNGTHITPDV